MAFWFLAAYGSSSHCLQIALLPTMASSSDATGDRASTERVSQPFERVGSTERVSQPFECVGDGACGAVRLGGGGVGKTFTLHIRTPQGQNRPTNTTKRRAVREAINSCVFQTSVAVLCGDVNLGEINADTCCQPEDGDPDEM